MATRVEKACGLGPTELTQILLCAMLIRSRSTKHCTAAPTAAILRPASPMPINTYAGIYTYSTLSAEIQRYLESFSYHIRQGRHIFAFRNSYAKNDLRYDLTGGEIADQAHLACEAESAATITPEHVFRMVR